MPPVTGQPELLMPQHLPMTRSNGLIVRDWRLYMQAIQDNLPGTPLQPSAGGTGVNNGSSTISVGGNLRFQGAFAVTFMATGVTNLTLPTSGTLATTAGTVGPIAGTANQITASAATGSVTLSLAGPHNFTTLASKGVLYGNGTAAIQALAVNATATLSFLSQVSSGTPAWVASTGTGSVVLSTSPTLVTPVLGVATATSITFGGSALSHYDEGTFVPTVSFGGSSVGVTYGVQVGLYARIGNRVFYQLHVTLTAKGAAPGTLLIGGLPVASVNTANSQAAAAVYADALNAGVTTQVEAWVNVNATTIGIAKYVAGASTALVDTDATNTSEFRIAGSYAV